MVSHISSPQITSRPGGETDRVRGLARAAATPAAGSSEDRLQLSADAGALPSALAAGPPIDAAMIAAIGTAIAEGRYPIDPDRIAEALFQDHADLNG